MSRQFFKTNKKLCNCSADETKVSTVIVRKSGFLGTKRSRMVWHHQIEGDRYFWHWEDQSDRILEVPDFG